MFKTPELPKDYNMRNFLFEKVKSNPNSREAEEFDIIIQRLQPCPVRTTVVGQIKFLNEKRKLFKEKKLLGCNTEKPADLAKL